MKKARNEIKGKFMIILIQEKNLWCENSEEEKNTNIPFFSSFLHFDFIQFSWKSVKENLNFSLEGSK